MKVSDSMYRILKRAVQTLIDRDEDFTSLLAGYKKKLDNDQYQQLVKDLNIEEKQ